MERKTFFLSDLHLLSKRSQADRHEEQIRDKAAQAGAFVLGGDIFDFRWSTAGSPTQSVDAAIGWLDRLVLSNPQCQFHFVFGNHDYNRRFIDALEDYETSVVNLYSHRYLLRLGGSVFLHGDAADRPHIWWGVSVENRRHGLPRIGHLREADPAMAFLSVEPLLEDLGEFDLSGIDWVIVGGESGHGARPMREEWVEGIRQLCERAGVPFFFKQWGGVRKSVAGRELNGRTYDHHPVVSSRSVPDSATRKSLIAAFNREVPTPRHRVAASKPA